jgi:hypothetical protein
MSVSDVEPRKMDGEPLPQQKGGTKAHRGVYIFVVVVIVLAVLIVASTRGLIFWGGDGELAMTLTLDSSTMPLNGSIMCHYKLTNVGSSSVRILPPFWGGLRIVDSNGSAVEYHGPEADRRPYQNEDLVTLRAGESWSQNLGIDESLWAITANGTYRVSAVYTVGEESEVWLPYWQGEVWSDTVPLSVM